MRKPPVATPSVLKVQATQTLAEVLRLVRQKHATVVVISAGPRARGASSHVLDCESIERTFRRYPERRRWSIKRAMGLASKGLPHPKASRTRPSALIVLTVSPPATQNRPAPAKAKSSAQGTVTPGQSTQKRSRPARPTQAVIPHNPRVARTPAAPLAVDLDLGSMRSAPRPAPAAPTPPAPPAAEVDVTISAEASSQINVNATARVAFQIELTSEALPLAASKQTRARTGLPIAVTLSVESDAVQVVRNRERLFDVPAEGEPRTGFFTVKGIRSGSTRLAVIFRQGAEELGVIGLTMEVVSSDAKPEKARIEAATSLPESGDDKLALLIEQRHENGNVFYEYVLHSEALDLPYRRYRSKPLLDRGNGLAATTIAFVERIYEQVTRELKSHDDLKNLQREARALGASLCKELFDPDVAAALWPLRERIKLIQIVSWEPYIPWELVRLAHPTTQEIDERFLCEYGLVRTLADEMPTRSLPLRSWRYLGAHFPMGTMASVGAELDYFIREPPTSLRAHGITPTEITTRDQLYDALGNCDFDVLHLSCHAESPSQAIDRASLIIGDETAPGETKPRLIEVTTATLEAEARLRSRRPLVFLNACETGRAGAVLTAWGGWPNVFLRKGAGAFVGSSWAVRDKPAAAFAVAFYETLLAGKTLAEAAGAARAAAKQLGDASWLAFKVYGHPRARRC